MDFSAGVLSFRPNSAVLENMKNKMEEAVYPLAQAEQFFLNLFFASNVLRLSYAYNANLAIKKVSPPLWQGMKDEIRVVRYTLLKPFVKEHSDSTKLPTVQRLHEILHEASEYGNGFHAEEVARWQKAYEDMTGELRTEIERM